MKIIDIQEKTVPINSDIKNAYISFAKMDCSVVAIKTDVKIDGKNVVGTILVAKTMGSYAYPNPKKDGP